MFFDKPGKYKVFIFSAKFITAFTIIQLVAFIGWSLWCKYLHDNELYELRNQIVNLEKTVDWQRERVSDFSYKIRNLEVKQQFQSFEHKEQQDKVRLLAILFNENMAALKNGQPNDVIFMGREWKINSMPRYLDMTRQDIQWLNKFLEKRTSAAPSNPSVPN